MKKLYVIALLCVCAFTSAEAGEKLMVPKLKIYLFSSSTCEKCKYLKAVVLPDLLENYPSLSYEHIPVDDTDNFKLMLLYEAHFGTSSDKSVKAFVGKSCLAGAKVIEARIDATIDKELAEGNITVTPAQIRTLYPESSTPNEVIEKKYDTFTWIAVAMAGLLDGINPCAFVTLVFFISVLTNLRKSKKDILIVGVLFSFAVFATYLLLGIGALNFIKIFSVQSGLAKGINICMAVFCLVIAIISLFDLMCSRKRSKQDGCAPQFTIKLPKIVRKTINRQINTRMRKGRLWFWALFLGVTISLLESLCTGQVYLPTLTIMVKQGHAEAFWLLIFYNIMFIIPLLAVFGLFFYGVSSKQITSFFNRNLLLSKVLMTLLFFSLGGYLLYITV